MRTFLLATAQLRLPNIAVSVTGDRMFSWRLGNDRTGISPLCAPLLFFERKRGCTHKKDPSIHPMKQDSTVLGGSLLVKEKERLHTQEGSEYTPHETRLQFWVDRCLTKAWLLLCQLMSDATCRLMSDTGQQICTPRTTTTTTSATTTPEATTTANPTNSTGTAPTVRQDFECHLNYISVFIPVDLVPNSELTLRDPSCRLTNNGTHYKISFDYDECGTSQSFYTDYVSVDNEVNVHSIFNDTELITFVENYKIPLHCSVDRNNTVNAAIQVVPRERIQESIVQSTDFYMKEFTTRDYDEQITEYPVQLPINREIFFEIGLKIGNSNSTGIFVEKCEATPSVDPNDTVHVSLIKLGCSAIPAVKVLPAPGNDRFRFSTQAFHFSTPANLVYVHCSMSTCGDVMCDTDCAQSSHRRKRSARGRAFETLTSGSHVVTKDGN